MYSLIHRDCLLETAKNHDVPVKNGTFKLDFLFTVPALKFRSISNFRLNNLIIGFISQRRSLLIHLRSFLCFQERDLGVIKFAM